MAGSNIEDKVLLFMALMVAIVAIVAIFSRINPDNLSSYSMTGMVVGVDDSSNGYGPSLSLDSYDRPVYDCSACFGYSPVCAFKNHRAVTYNNPCEAFCDGARIVFDRSCDDVPSAGSFS